MVAYSGVSVIGVAVVLILALYFVIRALEMEELPESDEEFERSQWIEDPDGVAVGWNWGDITKVTASAVAALLLLGTCVLGSPWHPTLSQTHTEEVKRLAENEGLEPTGVWTSWTITGTPRAVVFGEIEEFDTLGAKAFILSDEGWALNKTFFGNLRQSFLITFWFRFSAGLICAAYGIYSFLQGRQRAKAES